MSTYDIDAATEEREDDRHTAAGMRDVPPPAPVQKLAKPDAQPARPEYRPPAQRYLSRRDREIGLQGVQQARAEMVRRNKRARYANNDRLSGSASQGQQGVLGMVSGQ